MVFKHPLWFALLGVLPLLYWYISKTGRRQTVALVFSGTAVFSQYTNWRTALQQYLPILRGIAIALLIIALARPQKQWTEDNSSAEGIDIMLAVDVSPSMLSKDFEPDRLTAAKRVASDFVKRREFDRIGLIAFSAEAYAVCPLTTDHNVLIQFIRQLKPGTLEDGTAIGLGLATAVNRMKDSQTKTKIVILLTDGENNVWYIQPSVAADLATSMHIKVYTIGMGTEGVTLTPVAPRNPDGSYNFGYRQMGIDETLLKDIAHQTGGKYYRAYTENELEDIYREIDQLEKSKIDQHSITRTKELYLWFLLPALLLVFVEQILRITLLRSMI